ncbi:MAG: hypothetical protein GF350_10815, partial [Chitinivibrionales bacterium]|nr:hypothetical protein [Chitinivibrionales bacterium]
MMSRLFCLVIACAVPVLTGASPACCSTEEIALVVRTRGLVTVSFNENHKDRHIVTKGYTAGPGAGFQTGKDGFAEIVLINSTSRLYVRPETKFTLYFTRENRHSSEIVNVSRGRVLFDVHRRAGFSFDIAALSTLLWIEKGESFLDVNDATGEASLYVVNGTARIADDEIGTWFRLESGTVGYSGTRNRIFTGPVPEEQTRQLHSIVKQVRSLKGDGRLTSLLTIQETGGGSSEPQGTIAALTGVGVDIKAEPQIGYSFTQWKSVGGNVAFGNASAGSTTVIVQSNAIIAPQFSETPAQIEISSIGNGRVRPSGTITVEKNTPFFCALIPAPGHECTGWKKNSAVKVTKQGPDTAQVVLSADQGKIAAIFKPRKYSLIVTYGPGGSVSEKKTMQVEYRDTISLAAQAGTGHTFTHWEIVNGTPHILNPRKSNTSLVVDTTDIAVRAVFTDNPVSVVIIDHPQAILEPVDSINISRNDNLPLFADVDEGFMITGWQVASGKARVTGLERATVRARSDCMIMPTISEKAFTLTLDAGPGGTAVPAKPQTIIHGTPTIITALPDKGQQFLHWKIIAGWADIENPQKETTTAVLMNGDAAVRAIFAA